MGTPAAAVPSLKRILEDGHEVVAVYTQPDRPAGRGNRLKASPVKEFALENHLKIYQPTRIKTPEALEIFKSHNADAAVVVAYGRILPETFLHAFEKGAINVHFSLLPKYRGAAPVNWAIVGGETKTGVTTMQMDAGLDTGAILLQRESEISEYETAPELMEKLSFLGAGLLSETLAMYDELTAQPQDESQSSLAPILKKEDGLIDWSQSAFVIERRIRGFQPWPNAYTKFDSKSLILWEAQPTISVTSGISNGEVIVAQKDELVVQCGERTALRVLEVQPEARKRMAARDFINGMRLKVGDRFG